MQDDPIDWLQWPAKSAHPPETIEHPALYHMLDVAAVAECLIEPFPFPAALKQAFIALTGLHDLGKFSESFRNMLREGAPQFYRHWEVTEFLLYEADDRLAAWLGGIFDVRDIFYAAVAGHHGRPSGKDIIFEEDDFMDCVGTGEAPAQGVLDVFAELWPEASLDGLSKDEAISLSWWLPGFCTVADWVGFNPDWFAPQAEALPPQDYLVRARSTARKAVKAAGLIGTSPNEGKLFDSPLRPLQAACETLPLVKGPMLAILEDETGSGKTEAALLLAHRMALAGKGRGVFFALPTMATADAMFARILAVAGKLFERPSLALAHGRAGLSEAFRAVVAHAFTTHRSLAQEDWFSAVDDLNKDDEREDRGAAHIGESAFGSGVFYQYVCVNLDFLVKNLDGDAELAAKAMEALAKGLSQSTPRGKQNSYAHHPRAHYMLVERGEQAPRDLSGAFFDAVKGEHWLAESVRKLELTRKQIDEAYGQAWDAEAKLHVGESGTLADITAFAAEAVRGA